MSAEVSAEMSPVEQPVVASHPGGRLVRTLAKNLFALGLLGGLVMAYQTGYFSNDRISRGDWNILASFPKSHQGRVVYDAKFGPDLLKRVDAAGAWDVYNGARPDTVTLTDGALEMKYSLAWLGVYFNHKAFEAKAHYRVRFEAKVDGEPAAILMRNRQLDYMRQQVPTTGGAFKEFTADFAAPAGNFDQVRIIFMPDGRGKVSGALTLRKFRIERLEK